MFHLGRMRESLGETADFASGQLGVLCFSSGRRIAVSV